MQSRDWQFNAAAVAPLDRFRPWGHCYANEDIDEKEKWKRVGGGKGGELEKKDESDRVGRAGEGGG
jgi:hypothetical protein